MAGLLLLSSIPGDTEADNLVGSVFLWVAPNVQNLLHVPVYAGLFFSWWWALAEQRPVSTPRFITAIALSLAWGMVDESWQSQIPGRYGSLTDVSLDAVGIALGALYARRMDLRFDPG